MGKYFGTDGFRGEANKVLTADHAYKIGRYLGWYYNQNHRGRIIIGKDTRRSSYMFEYALVAGITASGADAFLLHVTTTPSVAYVVRTENFDCGIMVSASHNPYYDNGIKVMDGNGHKISAEVEAALEKYIDGEMGELPFALRDKVGVARDYAIGRNRYIGYLISLATRSYDGMRVGLDCSNGSTFNIAKSVFDALGPKHMWLAMSRTVPTSIWDVDRHISRICRDLSGRRIWIADLRLMEMLTGVLPWMRTAWKCTGIISCMSVGSI